MRPAYTLVEVVVTLVVLVLLTALTVPPLARRLDQAAVAAATADVAAALALARDRPHAVYARSEAASLRLAADGRARVPTAPHRDLALAIRGPPRHPPPRLAPTGLGAAPPIWGPLRAGVPRALAVSREGR